MLVLVRHAESARNVAKKGNRFFLDDEARKSVQGVADHLTPLTARGLEQAAQSGRALRARFGEFDYAYHSGYRRTRETLEGLLAAYPDDARARVRVRHHLFLRERDTGQPFLESRPVRVEMWARMGRLMFAILARSLIMNMLFM